jgi:hypothetical protein
MACQHFSKGAADHQSEFCRAIHAMEVVCARDAPDPDQFQADM